MKRVRNKKLYEKFPEPKFLPKREGREKGVRKYTTFQPEYVRLFFYFSLMGANSSQICKALDISHGTLKIWIERYPEVKKAMAQGRLEADARVAHAMYHAAVGYTHDEEVILTNKVQEFDEKGRVIRQWNEPLRVKTRKHYPPNVTAGLKWLASRQPETWSDKHIVKAQIQVEHSVDLSSFSIEELEVLNKLNVLQQNSSSHDDVEDISYEEE